jgi:hypothetical protein
LCGQDRQGIVPADAVETEDQQADRQGDQAGPDAIECAVGTRRWRQRQPGDQGTDYADRHIDQEQPLPRCHR